jgi:hypothetical protein
MRINNEKSAADHMGGLSGQQQREADQLFTVAATPNVEMAGKLAQFKRRVAVCAAPRAARTFSVTTAGQSVKNPITFRYSSSGSNDTHVRERPPLWARNASFSSHRSRLFTPQPKN